MTRDESRQRLRVNSVPLVKLCIDFRFLHCMIEQRENEIAVNARELGRQFPSAPKRSQGFLDLPPVLQQAPQIAPSEGKIGLERECTLKAYQRFVGFTGILERRAEIIVGF